MSAFRQTGFILFLFTRHINDLNPVQTDYPGGHKRKTINAKIIWNNFHH